MLFKRPMFGDRLYPRKNPLSQLSGSICPPRAVKGSSMAIFDDVPLTHEIRIDSTRLVAGDESSISVVFYNLNGRNFTRPMLASFMTHEQYLAMMEGEFGVKFAGVTIELAPINKPAIASHVFG